MIAMLLLCTHGCGSDATQDPATETLAAEALRPRPFNTPAPGAGDCLVEVALEATWMQGPRTLGVIAMNVYNVGEQNLPVPWMFTVNNRRYEGLRHAWNLELIQTGPGWVSGMTRQPWQELVAGGRPVTIAMIVEGDDSDLLPTGANINGVRCVVRAVKAAPAP